MFSDIREDGRSYESSSDSDPNDESASHHENLLLPPLSTSTNFDNINMSNGSAAETSNVADRVRKVLDFMSTVNLDLTGFLDALSWGDPDCFNDPKIRYARSTLLKSERLPNILHHWWKPLRTPGSHNKRPDGATGTMQNFALTCLQEIYGKELNNLSESFSSPAGDDVTEEDLKSTHFVDAIQRAQEKAPHLWSVLHGLSITKKQVARNTHKKPDKVVLIVLAMLLYTRSHHQNRFQKLFAIYFKFRGLSAKGFDTLHALGLIMSHKWTCDSVSRISQSAITEAHFLKDRHPWLLSYDNVNIPFRVFSQRIDKQSDIGAGSAATIYIKRNAKHLPPSANRDLQETQLQGMKNPLTPLDIFDLATQSYPRIQAEMKYQVLQFLLDCPQFNRGTYKDIDSPLLSRPPPVHQLPSGPENITIQYLLGTVNIPEASYEDNSKLIDEWLGQLHLNSPDMKERLGINMLLVWCGDQLTVNRLRNLIRFRSQDLNSFDRLDWLILSFGWLHFMMAHASGLHKQYLWSSRGRGLSHAFDLLNKKGLGVTSVKGPFHHDLSEIIYHSAEAHIREEWLVHSEVQSLDQLRSRSPEELIALAELIVQERVSSLAIETMDRKPKREKDEVLLQTMMCTRDFLHYIVLNEGIKRGDIGLMEDFIPHMLFRFIGGSNSNYAIEALEVLQGLHREWSPDVKSFIVENCWLINNTGKAEDFLPVDQAQEQNIKDIKVTYRSEGPEVDWEYLKTLHPAIHVIRGVTSHVEKEFNTLTRGKKHTVPQRELDVQKLQDSYSASKLHTEVSGRKRFSDKDYEKDYISAGALSFSDGKLRERWLSERTIERSTRQEWYTGDSSGSDMSEENT